ncbi:MAG: hypothetical protein Q8P84_03315 [Deltaproteobacteria bacterium]|nr:hypothetical protein [Deltaproteobacteria bacterium]
MRPMRLNLKTVTVFWTLLISFSVFAFVALPASLEDLAAGADLVFSGRCEAKRDGFVMSPKTQKKIPVIIYTFRVEESIKGDAGSTIDITQWNLSRKEAAQYGLYLVEASQFAVGQKYVLFLGPPFTEYPELRSVLGSNGQGMFVVLQDSKGVSKVVNAYGNRGIFKGVAVKSVSKAERNVLESPPGPVPYDDFTSLVKKIVKD